MPNCCPGPGHPRNSYEFEEYIYCQLCWAHQWKEKEPMETETKKVAGDVLFRDYQDTQHAITSRSEDIRRLEQEQREDKKKLAELTAEIVRRLG